MLPAGRTPVGAIVSHILYLGFILEPAREQLMPSKHSLVYWALAVKPQSGTTDNEELSIGRFPRGYLDTTMLWKMPQEPTTSEVFRWLVAGGMKSGFNTM